MSSPAYMNVAWLFLCICPKNFAWLFQKWLFRRCDKKMRNRGSRKRWRVVSESEKYTEGEKLKYVSEGRNVVFRRRTSFPRPNTHVCLTFCRAIYGHETHATRILNEFFQPNFLYFRFSYNFQVGRPTFRIFLVDYIFFFYFFIGTISTWSYQGLVGKISVNFPQKWVSDIVKLFIVQSNERKNNVK